MEQNTTANDYFFKRMQELGITDEQNKIALKETDPNNTLNTIHVNREIFRRHEKGIEIIVYTLDRHQIWYEPERKDEAKRNWKKRWSIIRYADPVWKDGKLMKYQMPKGAGSCPFFPPSLVEKYENKTHIETLVLTEGFFKAFKAHLHGIDCIGLPSITHMRDKKTGGLHPDIERLIKACTVSKVIWLTDGDCLDISSELEDEDGKPKDLSTRPSNFFGSVQQFADLLDQFKDVNKYFFHINSDDITGKPKGLDDLLCACPGDTDAIKTDLENVGKSGAYFTKFNVTFGVGKVQRYFHLDGVDVFYLHHVEKRPDLKGKAFKFKGTLYQWNDEDNKCDVVVPADATKYFRVGDNYFEFVDIPNQYKQLERTFQDRRKGTITDDHGKTIIRHIPKFKAFCNVPDHTNYAPHLHQCFNVYSPLDFLPEDDNPDLDESDCSTIIGFIRHIFGDQPVQCKINDQVFKTTTFQLGMDYMQLLYQKPQEKLPVLCLVSRENNTGKSTMGNLLRLMLASNVAIVGNQDIAAEFNAHWATKLVVVCDEAKIDKNQVVERIKMLSTAKKVMMNAKGRNQVEIDCFIKFVLITNNEDNFIYASDEDIRFWVLKVPKLTKDNPNIMESFVEEMPAFLAYLNKRTMATTKQGRMWFKPELLKTEALKKVIAHSQPVIEKDLRQYIRDMFFDFGCETILMTRKDLHKEALNNRYESSYLEKTLKENLKVDLYHVEDGQGRKIYKTVRASFPKWEPFVNKDGKHDNKRVDVHFNGRPYVFKRDQFLTPDEIGTTIIDPAFQGLGDGTVTTVDGVDAGDDLPF